MYHYTETHIVDAIEAVVNDAVLFSNDTYMGGYAQIERLKEVLEMTKLANEKCRDRQYLARMVYEVSQDAANPRPLLNLLWNIALTEMREKGNPGYQNNPLVRQVLHQLLYLFDYTSLPAYDKFDLWNEDREAVKKLAGLAESETSIPTAEGINK